VADVTIAVLSPPPNADFFGVLARTRDGQNTMVFAPHALTPPRLAHAFRMLSRSRLTDGEFPETNLQFQVPMQVSDTPSEEERELARAIVELLRVSAPRMVRDFGTLPAVTITVAPESTPEPG
jgi:hypothetical protein